MVLAHDVPAQTTVPSLDSCQQRFLWVHKKDDLAPHPDTGLVLQVGNAEKFTQVPQVLGLKSLDPLLRVSKQDPYLAAIENDEDDERLVQLELACESDGVASLVCLIRPSLPLLR